MNLFGTRISAKFIAQIFEGYPEASAGRLLCVHWKNSGDPVTHFYAFDILDASGRLRRSARVNFTMMAAGLRLFMEAKARGELNGVHWRRERVRGHFFANYDRTTIDAIAQFAIFGKVVD